jgi:SAM-dependent methyltransferase
MARLDWHDLHEQGDTPWEDGLHCAALEGLVRDLVPSDSCLLDIGCGVGTQTLHLASLGFRIRGIDIVPKAVEIARSRSAGRGLDVEFTVGDIYNDDLGGPYDLAFDRSVLSDAEDHGERVQFAKRVSSALVQGGWWLNITGCADNRGPDGGPDDRGYPRHTLADLVRACEPSFEVHSVRRDRFGHNDQTDFIAWFMLMKAR